MEEKEIKVIRGKGLNGSTQPGVKTADRTWQSMIGHLKSGMSADKLRGDIPILPKYANDPADKIRRAWETAEKLYIHLSAKEQVQMKLMFCRDSAKFFEVEIKIDQASGQVVGFKELGFA